MEGAVENSRGWLVDDDDEDDDGEERVPDYFRAHFSRCRGVRVRSDRPTNDPAAYQPVHRVKFRSRESFSRSPNARSHTRFLSGIPAERVCSRSIG